MHISRWPGRLALSVLVLSALTPSLSAAAGTGQVASAIPLRSATAVARGLDLNVFGSRVTMASSTAAVDGTTARASAAGVSLAEGTVTAAEVHTPETREALETCVPDVALFEVVHVHMACSESRAQRLPPVFAIEFPRHTGAAMLDPPAPSGSDGPSSGGDGGPQAVGRGSVASVDVRGTRLLEPTVNQLRVLLKDLEPRRGDTMDAVDDQIGRSSADIVRSLGADLGLRSTDIVDPVVALLKQLVEGAPSVTGLASIRLSVSTATSNTERERLVAFAHAGEGQIDLLPGMGTGGAPLLSIIVGAARSTSDYDQMKAGATPAVELPLTTISLGLALSGSGVTELTVSPGAPITLLAGTPLETTISLGQGRTTSNADGSLSAVVGGVNVQLLKGVRGSSGSKRGIELRVAHVESGVGGRTDVDGARPGATIGPVPVFAAGSVLVASVIVLAYTVRRRARSARSSPPSHSSPGS